MYALLAIAAWCAPSAAQTDAPPPAAGQAGGAESQPIELTLVGGDKVVWGFRVWKVDNETYTQFAYRAASQRFGRRFWRAALVEGTARVAVVRDDILHVFFTDGSHWRYGLMDTVATGRVAPPVSRGIQLPGGGVPLALCTDRENGAILALVTRETARNVIDEQRSRLLDKLRADAEAGGEDPESITSPPPIEISAAIGVVKYEDAEWTYLRPGPESRTPADIGTRSLLLSAGGAIHLLTPETGDAEGEIEAPPVSRWSYVASSVSREGWIGRAPLISQDPAVAAGAGWIERTPFVVTIEQSAGGARGRTYSLTDDTWTAGPELADKSGAALSLDDSSRAALMGDKIVALFRDTSGALRSATFSAADGTASGTALVADALDRSPAQRPNPITENFIQITVLIGVMAALFFYRRERVVALMPIPAGTVCARLFPRLAAIIIDVLITAPFWMIALYALIYAVSPTSTVSVHLTLPPEELATIRAWAGAVIGAVVAVYACICELATGRTVGKWILRLSITEDGREKASPKAIILRNAARIIEFHFFVLALLVVLTPSRQRLGDLLARTVIVEPESDETAPTGGDDFDQTA